MPTINWDFPYPSQRMPVFARNVVATSQPLASQAGMMMFARGGNAFQNMKEMRLISNPVIGYLSTPCQSLEVVKTNFDVLVKSRHTGENRCPVFL